MEPNNNQKTISKLSLKKIAKLSLKSYLREEEPPRQRAKYKQKQSQIRALKNSYACGNRTLENYWGTLCELMDIY